jgi:hypothetical protein
MSLTSDPNDPRLGRGSDTAPRPMSEVYLVLSEAERAKGFVRPYREVYKHVGIAGPKYPLRDLTDEETERYSKYGYAKYEDYPKRSDGTPADSSSVLGTFWTQARLDSVGKGCGTVTTMGRALSETYARDPHFYGSTYCVGCQMHRPVGPAGEFVWEADGERVGT